MRYLLSHQESDRLLFRPIAETDFETWLPFFKSKAAMQHWPMGNLTAEEYAHQWYEKQWHRYKHNWGGMNALILKDSQTLIGHAGLLTQKIENKIELEVAYSLLPDYWQKGYATETALKCKNVAFEEGYCQKLVALIAPSNTPSIAVAKSLGMKKEKRVLFQEVVADLYYIEHQN
ncbi:MAG: GNAT family N-acetyltransferase [Candidatus Arcticimaribacter sp.]